MDEAMGRVEEDEEVVVALGDVFEQHVEHLVRVLRRVDWGAGRRQLAGDRELVWCGRTVHGNVRESIAA